MDTRASVRVALVVAAALLLATSVPADQSRPMRGSFTGSGFTFTGNYSHMGLITGEVTSFIPTATGGLLTSIAVAADGDELHASSELTITGVNPSTGMLTFVQVLDFTGGTGRFEGATGQVEATGEVAADQSSFFGEFTGWIDY